MRALFRTYECGKEKGVAKVSSHLAAFGDGSGNDRGGCCGECELEEPADVFTSARKTLECEHGSTDEGATRSVGQSISKRVETDGSSTRIQQVLEHDVLDVLLTDGTCTEHGETRLHQKDDGSGKQQEKGVDTVREARDGALKATDAVLDSITQFFDG